MKILVLIYLISLFETSKMKPLETPGKWKFSETRGIVDRR